MIKSLHDIKPGVIFGDDIIKVFDIAKKKNFAIPAINCSNIDIINTILDTAFQMKSPIIIQLSYGGSSSIAGNINNISNNKKSVLGALSAANHIHLLAKEYKVPVILHTDHCYKNILPWIDQLLKKNAINFKKKGKSIFSSHMIDLSKEDIKKNINISCEYLIKMHQMNMILEVELGCTGGEEEGINNNNIHSNLLYTKPKEVYQMYSELIKISPNFIIAANFGNTHGVYTPGHVNLKPKILRDTQKYIHDIYRTKNKNPINFVFHGGSGSSISDIQESIQYGVVKINIDTDIQWAAWKGILKYYKKNKLYLYNQLIKINGINTPNKKYYDPRSWIKASQMSISKKLKNIFKILNCYNLF